LAGAEVEEVPDEVEEDIGEVDEPAIEVLVATTPEVSVKYATKDVGAGASNDSFVGSSQLGLPLLSMPQQYHSWVVAFHTTSGLASSTM